MKSKEGQPFSAAPLSLSVSAHAAVANGGVHLGCVGLGLDLVQPVQVVDARGDGDGAWGGHVSGFGGQGRRGQAEDRCAQTAGGDDGESELLHFLLLPSGYACVNRELRATISVGSN